MHDGQHGQWHQIATIDLGEREPACSDEVRGGNACRDGGGGRRRPGLRPARPDRTLIKGGVVLSFDRGVGDFDKADVLIEGKKIAAVRPNISADAQVIDASRMIVLPGFIDTHHHFYQSALRNVLANGVLADYFRDISGAATNFTVPRTPISAT